LDGSDWIEDVSLLLSLASGKTSKSQAGFRISTLPRAFIAMLYSWAITAGTRGFEDASIMVDKGDFKSLSQVSIVQKPSDNFRIATANG
jgi:hypothetical protein